MDFDDFEPGRDGNGEFGGFSRGYSPYSTPRWDDFTLDDEEAAKKRFSRIFLSLFVYQLLTLVLVNGAAVVASFIWGEGAAEKLSYTVLLIINSIAAYAIAFPVLFLMQRRLRSTERTKTNISFGKFMLIFLVAEAFMYIGNIIGTTVNDVISVIIGAPIDNSTADMIINTPIYVIIPIAVVIGPIFEELIFRKLMIDKLGMYGDKLAIVVSAIAFGIFHGNLYQFFYAAMLGLVLGYIYTRTGNILYPIALHMLINLFGSAVPMLFYDELIAYEEYAQQMIEGVPIEDMAEFLRVTLIAGTYSMIQLGMVIAGIIIFFTQRKRIFVSDRCEVLIPKKRRWGVIVGNVGAILFLVLMGILITSEIVIPMVEQMLEGGGMITPDGLPPEAIPPTDGTPDIPDM